MTELKPCPHCECDTPWLSSAKHTQGLRWYVFCHVCGAKIVNKRELERKVVE